MRRYSLPITSGLLVLSLLLLPLLAMREAKAASLVRPRIDYMVGRNPHGTALGDVNRDGFPDIVSANSTDNNVTVLLNDGRGSFLQAISYAVEKKPQMVVLGDVNGDGFPDIVAIKRDSNDVAVLLNDGHGGFLTAMDYSPGRNQPTDVALGDVNRDGFLDIVTANSASNTVSVLLNDGHGGFLSSRDFSSGASPSGIVAGDVNGDGFLDIITTDANDTNVTVLFNDGHGGFSKRDVPVGHSQRQIALGDLNGDGFLDIVTSDDRSNAVTVLLNDRHGGFLSGTDYPTGSTLSDVAVGDINGDGFLDIVTANFAANTTTVLLNDGHASFALRKYLQTGAGPVAVALGDLNGDGFADIAVSNSVDGTVTVLLTPMPANMVNIGAVANINLAFTPNPLAVGQQVSEQFQLQNTSGIALGPSSVAFPITISGTVSAGLSNLFASGTGWSVMGIPAAVPSAPSGPDSLGHITATYIGPPIANGQFLPTLTIGGIADGSVIGTYRNTSLVTVGKDNYAAVSATTQIFVPVPTILPTVAPAMVAMQTPTFSPTVVVATQTPTTSVTPSVLPSTTELTTPPPMTVPQIEVIKQTTNGKTFKVGDSVIFEIVVRNALGSLDLTGPINVSDVLPIGLKDISARSFFWSIQLSDNISPALLNATFTPRKPIRPGETLPLLFITGTLTRSALDQNGSPDILTNTAKATVQGAEAEGTVSIFAKQQQNNACDQQCKRAQDCHQGCQPVDNGHQQHQLNTDTNGSDSGNGPILPGLPLTGSDPLACMVHPLDYQTYFLARDGLLQ